MSHVQSLLVTKSVPLHLIGHVLIDTEEKMCAHMDLFHMLRGLSDDQLIGCISDHVNCSVGSFQSLVCHHIDCTSFVVTCHLLYWSAKCVMGHLVGCTHYLVSYVIIMYIINTM